ncbi:MAG: hypothetical protein U1E06_20640 [Tabrizicola sp.]|uniref:hypothetical protein n=1 Tax=Tabrizicola sp. TaxID=2005166 RepID=UPI002733A55A|nr:hypothetical protein [Tabrizicola sp.]MDP3265142.1 hypothetical protein [Tabrizicola sp.]MDP3646910.1 hypothetical protein [Paracoccaceae bacterium]MDZ4069211.1 hypothetical protein [Tabrizicola sp.]
MRDSQHDEPRQRDGSSVSLLAAEALARLVARDGKPSAALSVTVLERLTQAFLDPGTGALSTVHGDLRRHRVTDADLVDYYLPQIARTLGVDWETDRISFAALSIAVARMQAFLREISAGWAGQGDGAATVGAILLIVPQNETHTLGPMTVLGQLRRRGLSVCLKIGPSIEDLRLVMQHQSFDGAIISVACRENLDLCRKLVTTLKQGSGKQGSGGTLPVALGGAVLWYNDTAAGALPPTGADIATNDLTVALATFGLSSAPRALELEHG